MRRSALIVALVVVLVLAASGRASACPACLGDFTWWLAQQNADERARAREPTVGPAPYVAGAVFFVFLAAGIALVRRRSDEGPDGA